MCLTEYDEAKTMRLFKEEGREEGREELLVRQICRKLRKGKTPDLITEELEEDTQRERYVFRWGSTTQQMM